MNAQQSAADERAYSQVGDSIAILWRTVRVVDKIADPVRRGAAYHLLTDCAEKLARHMAEKHSATPTNHPEDR